MMLRGLIQCVSIAVLGCCVARLATAIETESESTLPSEWTRITRDGEFKQRPVWSPDGTKLLFTRHIGESVQSILCDADGVNEKRLFDNPHPRFDAAFFADGKRLAFTFDKITPGQGDMELYLADADGENIQPLFVTNGKLSHEEWASPSPDGKWIACTSTRDDNSEVYLIKVDGTDKQRLTSDPALDVHPSFSPDGKKIAFATDRWGDFEIAVYNLETSLITRLTESRGLDDYPCWSPDAKQIAFTSRRNGNLEIYIMQSDGTSPRNLTQHEGSDNFPTFSPKGEVTFCSQRDGEWDIYSLRP